MSARDLPVRSRWADHWNLDDRVVFLNHGSFGACPRAVREKQRALQDQMESDPIRFFLREALPLHEEALASVAAFLGADPRDMAFVPNATTGVNAVLRSMPLQVGDELLITDHAYGACKNVVDFVAHRAGATVVVAKVPYPLEDSAQVTAAISAAITDRTRLALIDWITSPTALVWPVIDIVRALHDRDVEVLIDGAHVPGHVPCDLTALGAEYFVGNCHKWLCTPKGSAVLHVRADKQERVRPTSISHGATMAPGASTRFRHEFDWTGTADPTAFFSVPTAIHFLGGLMDGGWPELMRRNHQLALDAREILADALGTAPPCKDDMVGMFAALPLPNVAPVAVDDHFAMGPLQRQLWEEHDIEVPIIPFGGRTWVRVSCQAYNSRAEIEYLASVLATLIR